MQVIFIGSVVPENIFSRISKVSPSTNNVQLNYIRYLYDEFGESLSVLSCHFGTRNISQKKGSRVQPLDCICNDGIEIHCIGFNSKRLFLNISAVISMINAIRRTRNKQEKTLFIVNNHFYAQALPAFLLKRKQDYMITVLNEAFDVRYIPAHGKPRIKDHISNIINRYILKTNDGLITFCKGTVEQYARNVPYTVLIHPCDVLDWPRKIENVGKYKDSYCLLYAGLINDCYGIREILDSFVYLPDNYKLIICGGGDEKLVELIKTRVSKDDRIEYRGMIPRSEVLQLEMNSDVLLLIRTSKTRTDEYLARYSAPSKIAEYLCSKTPVLATDVECIPVCFKRFMTFTESDAQQLAESIVRMTTIDRKKVNDNAISASQFVNDNCGIDKQKKEFITFVKKIIDSERAFYAEN